MNVEYFFLRLLISREWFWISSCGEFGIVFDFWVFLGVAVIIVGVRGFCWFVGYQVFICWKQLFVFFFYIAFFELKYFQLKSVSLGVAFSGDVGLYSERFDSLVVCVGGEFIRGFVGDQRIQQLFVCSFFWSLMIVLVVEFFRSFFVWCRFSFF